MRTRGGKAIEKGADAVQATSMREAILQELEQERPRTIRILERVPADRWEWRPHAKSSPMGALASHVATLPFMVSNVMTSERYEMGSGTRPPRVERAEELVPLANRLFDTAAQALRDARDEDVFVPWTFVAMGHTIMDGVPRFAALRTFYANHLVHHRAQLGVYLRLCDVPVPGTYGPSADEPM